MYDYCEKVVFYIKYMNIGKGFVVYKYVFKKIIINFCRVEIMKWMIFVGIKFFFFFIKSLNFRI